MAEILTESFCERCGTRYTFEASAPRKGRVGKFRTLSKGLKNYVLSDEATLEEALDEARGEEERTLSTQQLEAFHQTFNFCMSCRQYTCANCWNELEARCLSCAPDLSHDVLPTAFPDLPIVPTYGLPATAMAPDLQAAPDASWPTTDVAPTDYGNGQMAPPQPILDVPAEAFAATAPAEPFAATASTEALAQADPSQVTVEPPAEAPSIDEPIDEEPDERLVARLAALGAVRVVPTMRPETPAVEDPMPTALEPERSVEEDEAEIAAMIAATEVVDAQPEPMAPQVEVPAAAPVDIPAAEPIAAQAPEPIQFDLPVSPPPQPIQPETPASMPAAATLADRVGWTMVAPEAPLVNEDRVAAAQPTGNGHHPTAAPPPVWPTPVEVPQWPAPQAGPAPVAAGTSVRHGTAALWVASSRDVVSHPGSGVSACVSCGLPLSANARFCRRCGSRQAS